MFERDLIRKESLKEKCSSRDEQAQIILEIIRLAKKLNYCHYELSEKIRYPDYVDDKDIETLRKKLDSYYWRQCLDEYQVEKFLTTTDKEKLHEKIEEDTPTFNFENVMNTIHSFMGSKEATATNMIKKIYEEVTDCIFRVGNHHRNKNEKRLQLGIPQNFRLSIFYTHSQGLPSYISSTNSRFNIIDDFERACYLVDGGLQPDRQENITSLTDTVLRKANGEPCEVDSPYFTMKLFKNGNVKINVKSKEVLEKLNVWGQKGNRLK